MKKIKAKTLFSGNFLFIILVILLTISFQNKSKAQDNENLNDNKGFIQETGQFQTFNDLKFHMKNKNVHFNFLPDRIVFFTKGIKYTDNEESLDAVSRGDMNLAKKLSAVTEVNRFDLLFVNSNPNVEVIGEQQKNIQVDYYLGHCPDGILNVPAFDKIRYHNIYPNIDLIFYQEGEALKYEFIVYPNGDPSLINLQWDGVNNIYINENKEIQFSIASFNFYDKAPVSFNGDKQIKTNYILNNNNVSFNIDNYNNQDTLIIDPALYWASSLEYNGYGTWGGLVTNSNGDFYIVDWEWNPGNADVANYLASAGSSTLYSSDLSNDDIIISRFNKSGALTWACRYGGTGDDDVNGGVAIDDNDNLYIAGTSRKNTSLTSGNFPLQTLSGAFNQAWDGSLSVGTRGYLLKFTSTNTRQWSTYLDRGANLEVFDIEIGSSNRIYMVGKSGGSPTYISSGSIPYGSGYSGALNGTTTATSFIMSFYSSGALYWTTWLPGATASTSTGRACDIAINKSTNYVYIAGDEMWSSSTRFATALISAGYTNQGSNDMFYMGFNGSNQPIASYGKYIGGAGFDKINIGAANGDIELDGSGNLYVCGHTYSANFPTVDPGGCAYYDGTINDGSGISGNVASTQDGYLFKVNTSGTITYSTFFGGTAYTSMKMLKKDSHDNLWICGTQNPAGLSTVNHNDYYNQTFAGTSSNIMFAQLRDDDLMEWLSYYGFTTGYSGYGGFDIWEPTTDSMYLCLTGKFNYITNTGGGYQYSATTTFSGAAQFRHYLSTSAPFTISGSNPICQGASATWSSTSSGGTWSSSNTSVATVNSSTGVVTGVSAGTTDITYTLTVGGCPFYTTETVTILSTSTTPTSLTASPTSICSGSSTTLTVNGGSLGTGSGWYLYSGSCGGTLVDFNSSGVFTVSPTSTTTYYVRAMGPCNNTTCRSVTVTVYTASSTPTSLSASPTSVCSGSPTTLTVNGGSLGIGSSWYLYSGSCGGSLVSSNTTGTFTVSPTSTTTYYVRASGPCNTTSCVSRTITVTPDASIGSVTGSSPICDGTSTTFSANSVVLGGGTGTWSSSNTSVATVNSSGVVTAQNAGTCNILYTITGGCGGTVSAQQSITVTPDASIASVTGSSPICDGTSTTFSANSVVLGGGTGTWSSSNTSVATVNSSGVVSGVNAGTCNIIYTITGGCGGTVSAQQSITVTPDASIASVTGSSPICDGTSTTFSANSVVLGGGTGTWSSSNTSVATVNSSGVVTAQNAGTCNIIYTITGGCGGTVSAQQSITVTPDASIASVTGSSPICDGTSTTFSANSVVLGGGTGTWSSSNTSVATVNSSGVVTAQNAGTCNIVYTITGGCGGTVSAQQSITVTPNASIGSVTGSSPICEGTSTTFSASSVVLGGGTGTWSSSNTSVATVNSSGIVTAQNAGTCNIIYTITGGCGGTVSAQQSITVNPATPVTPGAISGLSPVCPGTSGLIYSISSVTGATTYTWTVPTGWTINAGTGTTSISVTSGGAGQNGNISVTASNTCGTSAATTFPVVVSPDAPATPGLIAGSTPVCPGTSQTYSISSVTNATTYTWTVPTGWTITGGNGTTSITVTAGSAGQNGDVSVTAGNTCGTSAASTLPVVVSPEAPATPGAIVGSSSVCPGSTGLVYSITSVTGATTYTWTVPTGWTITGGNGTTSITVTSGSTGQNGTITVTAGNSCGTSAASTLNVSVTGTVTADVSIGASENPICANTSVTFTATPTNGGGSPSYQWYLDGNPVGFNSSTYTNASLTSGNTIYCVMTSSEACATGNPATSSTITMTVNAPSTDPTSATALNSTICSGSSTDVSVTGGSLGLGADWYWYEGGCGSGTSIGNGSTINVSPASTTVYYVRAEGTCNNTACVSVVINVTASPNAGTSNIVDVCEGDPNFDLFIQLGGSPTGGGIWTNSGGSTVTSTFNPSAMTGDIFTYTVTGTPPCGDATATITVTVNPLPNVSFTGLDSIYCGGSDPIILTGNQAPNGTFAGMDVTDNGNGTADYTHATPGTYDITYSYTNSFGCTNVDTQTVQIYPLPNVSFVGLDTAYCQGAPIVNIIGNQAPDGTFSGPGITDNGNGSATYDPNTTGLQVIIYEYTDGNGCTASDAQTIEVYSNPTVSLVNVTDVTVCTPPYNGEITVLGSGGAGNYQYAIDGGILTPSGNFSGLDVGAYTITIEDDLGCNFDTLITVNSNTGFNIDSVEVTNVVCYGDTTGQLIIHALNGVQYSIDNGATYFPDSTFNNLPAGTYNITAQDAGNCTDIFVVTINEPDALLLDSTVVDVICGGNNGSATINVTGGTSPYYFLWSNDSTTATINNLNEGTYDVTVTDDNGCIAFSSAIVSNSGGVLSTSINSTNVTCFGFPTGEATVSALGSGSYEYIWSNGDTTATITNLTDGTYYVTVNDLAGCTGIDTVTITEPDILAYTDSVVNISCYGLNNGEVYLNTTGGTPPYTYTWVGTGGFSSTDEDITDLSVGVYNVSIIDANGCDLTKNEFRITEPEELLISELINDASCIGNDDGEISVAITGGATPYALLWSTNPTQTDTIATGLLAGNYTLTITDNNNCFFTQDYVVEEEDYECFIIPSVFTPNSDGVNDKWELKGIWMFNEVSIEIYNRWGDIIFKHEGSGSEYASDMWDGTYNGRELPISSYVYIIDLKNGSEPYQGVVTIKK